MLVVCESKCFHSLKRKGLQERSENKIPLHALEDFPFFRVFWNLLLKSFYLLLIVSGLYSNASPWHQKENGCRIHCFIKRRIRI